MNLDSQRSRASRVTLCEPRIGTVFGWFRLFVADSRARYVYVYTGFESCIVVDTFCNRTHVMPAPPATMFLEVVAQVLISLPIVQCFANEPAVARFAFRPFAAT
jgi:hypothetical protein